jgi:hypothetical protein
MSHKHGAYLGGIRTLEDVRLRCYVDPRSGCWHWRLNFSRGRSSCVWFIAGVEHKGTASRAAWALSGHKLQPGWVVSRYRSVCDSQDCCNPAHHRAGPRARILPKLTPEQRTAHRIGVTRESRRRSKLSMEAALLIRQSDAPCHEEAAKWGVGPTTISQIRRGETWRPGFAGGVA